METISEKVLSLLSMRPEPIRKGKTDHGWDQLNPLSILEEVFPNLGDLIKDKAILDYGCGWGYQSVALVLRGAKYVLGLDTNINSLNKARELLKGKGLEKQVSFQNILPDDTKNSFDIVISQNSMEHFSNPFQSLLEMKAALKPGGKIFITFGPLWFTPYGSHMSFFTKVPWVHVLFSERTVMNVRKKFRNDQAQRYEEVEGGLNKMTVKKFENLVLSCGLKFECRDYDSVKRLNFLGKLPYLRELFVNRINCILIKNQSG